MWPKNSVLQPLAALARNSPGESDFEIEKKGSETLDAEFLFKLKARQKVPRLALDLVKREYEGDRNTTIEAGEENLRHTRGADDLGDILVDNHFSKPQPAFTDRTQLANR